MDTGRKLNVHKTFRRRPERLMNVLCMLNLHPVLRRILVKIVRELKLLTILAKIGRKSWKITILCRKAKWKLPDHEFETQYFHHRVSFLNPMVYKESRRKKQQTDQARDILRILKQLWWILFAKLSVVWQGSK